MSFLFFLWNNYKSKEEEVFDLVFTSQDQPKPTNLAGLVQSLKQFLNNCEDGAKFKIRYLLKEALLSREKSRNEYTIRQKRAIKHGNTRLSSYLRRSIDTHAHYFSELNGLLPKDMQVKKMNTAPQQTPKLTVKGHVPIVAERFACLELEEQETTDTESEYTERSASLSEEKVAHGGGHSLDEDEFDLFCTLIECNLSEILSTWKDMLKHEIRPITAAAITNCIYNEISSSLEQARLLAPHWFNEEFLMRKDDMFHEGLNIIFEREKDSLWNSVMDVAIKMDRSIVPIFVGDFIYSFVMVRSGLKDRDFYIFRFSVGLRLLRLIQSVEGNEKSRVDELQEDTYKALDFLHNVMSHPMTPKFTCQGVDKVIQEAKRLRPIVQGLREPSILCSITLWSVVQVQEVFMQLLGNPLIAMTAHIYVYLRISNLVGPTPQLESFCTKHESMLFWNCRPLTLKDWGISYERWVIPREETAEEIACLRLKRYKSNFLMREFSLNDFKLTNDLKNKFSSQPGKIFDTMRLELEREMPSNTVVLYDSVSEIVRVIFRSQLGFPPSIAIEDVQLAYMFYKYIDRVAEPFILRLKEMQDFA